MNLVSMDSFNFQDTLILEKLRSIEYDVSNAKLRRQGLNVGYIDRSERGFSYQILDIS